MFDLNDFLPYLINRAGARMASKFSRALRPHGISLQEWRVLAALAASGEQRMSELSTLTSFDRTTLSRIVGHMAIARLIYQKPNIEDLREVLISLSANGRRKVTAILPLAHHFEGVSIEGISTDDAIMLKRLLRHIYSNLDRL